MRKTFLGTEYGLEAGSMYLAAASGIPLDQARSQLNETLKVMATLDALQQLGNSMVPVEKICLDMWIAEQVLTQTNQQ